MLDRKFQQVRLLSNKIAEFVEALNIEGCNELLNQRLTLLQEIQIEVEKLDPTADNSIAQEFKNLLTWLEDLRR